MKGLAEVLDENARLRRELAEATDKLEAVQRKAEYLARQLELAQLRRTGPASQRYVPAEQASLPFHSDVSPPPRAPTPTPQSDEESTERAIQPKGGGKPRRRNRGDFNGLPKRNVRVQASEAHCAGCGKPLQVIGTAESFRIEWVPGHFEVHEVERDKVACPACPDQGVLTASGPYALDRSMAGNGLVARVLVDKFVDHIPANRQSNRMAREGFDVGSHTLSSWIGQAARLLVRVALAVRSDVLEATAIQGDDTGMPVQDGADGKLRKARMWSFTDQQQVFYDFTDTKAGEFPAQLLANYAGRLLLVDGGSEFNEVERKNRLLRGGCWSHLRTYFWDARHHHPGEAALALGTIHDLFMIERELWGATPDVVLAGRKARCVPLVNGFFEWAKALSRVVRPDSTLGAAITYALNQETRLRLHLEHGELPMHNNLSELMLRQLVVGRKNWLFARSEGGAQAAATIYTLVGSCMLQGIDPWAYLVDVLDRILDHPANRVSELTPKAWAASRKQVHTATAG